VGITWREYPCGFTLPKRKYRYVRITGHPDSCYIEACHITPVVPALDSSNSDNQQNLDTDTPELHGTSPEYSRSGKFTSWILKKGTASVSSDYKFQKGKSPFEFPSFSKNSKLIQEIGSVI
jgi:hypothetical protein